MTEITTRTLKRKNGESVIAFRRKYKCSYMIPDFKNPPLPPISEFKGFEIILYPLVLFTFVVINEAGKNSTLISLLEWTYVIVSSFIMILLIWGIGISYNMNLLPLYLQPIFSWMLTIGGICIFLLGAISLIGIICPVWESFGDWWFNEL